MAKGIKVVEGSHYHIWTDGLHARALARQARNAWDGGAYVRWAILSAWTAFEIACTEALGADRIGERFKERLNQILTTEKGLTPINWGDGSWQRVAQVYERRKEYTHRKTSPERLLAPVTEADHAIETLRRAIKEIYNICGKSSPGWEDDDFDLGWDRGERPPGDVLHAAGVDEDTPGAILIYYVFRGEEILTTILPPGADWRPSVTGASAQVFYRFSGVRVRIDGNLVHEENWSIRGAK